MAFPDFAANLQSEEAATKVEKQIAASIASMDVSYSRRNAALHHLKRSYDRKDAFKQTSLSPPRDGSGHRREITVEQSNPGGV